MKAALGRETGEKKRFPMFQSVQKTGVIFATSRAQAHGFSGDDPNWANMGQVKYNWGQVRLQCEIASHKVLLVVLVGSSRDWRDRGSTSQELRHAHPSGRG